MSCMIYRIKELLGSGVWHTGSTPGHCCFRYSNLEKGERDMKIKSREAILEKEVITTVLSTLLSSIYILSRQPIEETKNEVLGMSLLRTQHFLGLFHLKWSVIPGTHQTIKPETPLCTLEIYSIRRERIAEEKNTTGQLSRYRRHNLQYHSDKKPFPMTLTEVHMLQPCKGILKLWTGKRSQAGLLKCWENLNSIRREVSLKKHLISLKYYLSKYQFDGLF